MFSSGVWQRCAKSLFILESVLCLTLILCVQPVSVLTYDHLRSAIYLAPTVRHWVERSPWIKRATYWVPAKVSLTQSHILLQMHAYGYGVFLIWGSHTTYKLFISVPRCKLWALARNRVIVSDSMPMILVHSSSAWLVFGKSRVDPWHSNCTVSLSTDLFHLDW